MNPNTKDRILRALSGRPGETTARWLRRAECQITFARAFAAALPPAETGGWGERIERAQALLDTFNPNEGLFGLSSAVKAAEAEMEPIGRVARQYRIHCVGHGHIDMNWMWSWPETVATTHDTFASVLSLMEQYPELTYSQSQASVYALVERHYPEMFEKIKERVREGRWEISAVHWVEGDKNIASGESICRHLLHTRRYFEQKFGLSPEDLPLDWEPDTFGHAVTVPGILAQGAVKYYYSCRPGGGFEHAMIGAARPRLFRWRGPDGSTVLVNREATWYNSYVNIGENIALPLVDFVGETGLHEWLNVYGVGNHGGGPTRAEIDYYREMQEWPVYPQVLFSTALRYFQALDTEIDKGRIEIPTLDHELNFEFTGCYTSQSLIKQANRFGENYCVEAETLATLAARLHGQPYPTDRLREAWINVLFNQFHDILPGSGVRETREHALALFQETGAITGSIKRAAGRALVQSIDTLALLPDTPEADEERQLVQSNAANTPFVAGAGIGAGQSGFSQASGGGRRFLPFVVYNPCAWTRSERVTVALYDTPFNPARVVARDENGVNHPTFFLGRGADWAHNKINVAFDARDVPALGYRTYLLCEGTAGPVGDDALVRAISGDTFETPFFRVRFDRYGSGIPELTDKRTGARVSWPEEYGERRPLGEWQYITERPRGMTAWALGGEVDPPVPLKGTGFRVLGAARNEGNATISGDGVLGYRIEQDLEVPGTTSTVRLSVLLHALAPRIDFTATIDWREIGDQNRGIPGLVVSFPTDLDEGSLLARYEAPFGNVERSGLQSGEEVPTLRYAHLFSVAGTADNAEVPAGVTLTQDCKYGHSLDGSNLRLRIVRSSFDPDHAPEVAQTTVRYSLHLHDQEADPATLARLGADRNHPLIVFPANLQSGDAPATRGFVNVRTPNVVLTALKEAEDGGGLVLRLVEMNGADTEAEVEIDAALAGGLTTATLLDLMERPVSGGSATLEGNTLRVPIRAQSFVTVRLARG